MRSQNVSLINPDTGTRSPPQPDTYQGPIIKQHVPTQIVTTPLNSLHPILSLWCLDGYGVNDLAGVFGS